MAEESLPQRDIVVTVPKDLWGLWLEEGDLPGDPSSGTYWSFWCGGAVPDLVYGDEEPLSEALPLTGCGSDNIWKYLSPSSTPPRCYVVAHGRLRGYAPLYAVEVTEAGQLQGFIRRGGAVAVTIPEEVCGFRGWRYRWWDREQEKPFPDWETAGVPRTPAQEVDRDQ